MAAKKKPARKARRKPAPEKVYVVLWYQSSGLPWLYYTSRTKRDAEATASLSGDCKVITYTREVLPRKRGGKR